MNLKSVIATIGFQSSEIFFVRIYLTLISLLSAAVLVREWGVEVKGEYALFFSCITICYIILAVGTQYALFHFLNEDIGNYQLVKNIYIRHISVAFLITFIFITIIEYIGLAYLGFETIKSLKFLLPVGLLSIFLNALVETYYISSSKIRSLTIFRVLRLSSQVGISLFIILNFEKNLNLLLIGYILSDLTNNFVFLLLINRVQQFSKTKLRLREFYRFAISSSPQSILQLSPNTLFPFLTGNFLGLEMLGLLTVANSFGNFLLMFFKTVSSLLQREFTNMDILVKKKLLQSTILLHFLLYSIISFITFFVIGFLVELIYGLKGQEIKILCMVVILLGFPTTLQSYVNAFFMSSGKPIIASKFNIITAILLGFSSVIFLQYFDLVLTILLLFVFRLIIVLIFIRSALNQNGNNIK